MSLVIAEHNLRNENLLLILDSVCNIQIHFCNIIILNFIQINYDIKLQKQSAFS